MQEGKKLPMSIRSVLPLLPLCILSACAANTDTESPSESAESTGVTAQAELGGNQGNDDHQGDDNQRVLLISVDGMHQSDLDWYVANHPNSTLAKLVHSGSEYTRAATSNPSDSDPGGTALMTGGNPKSTGVFYDVEYSHKVDEMRGAACTPGQPASGGDVIYDSPDDAIAAVPDLLNNGSGNTFPAFDENGSIFANGVDTNPAAIMDLKFDPETSLNSGTFPVDPKTCKPITPWDYLGDNTIFQVIHNAGLRTAWSAQARGLLVVQRSGLERPEHRRPVLARDRLRRLSCRTVSLTPRTTTGRTSTPPPRNSTTATRSRPS